VVLGGKQAVFDRKLPHRNLKKSPLFLPPSPPLYGRGRRGMLVCRIHGALLPLSIPVSV